MKPFLFILTATATFAADWPMHRGSQELHGRASDPAPATPAVRWKYAAAQPVKGSAAIVGGRVFVGDGDGVIHCIGLADGKPVWRFETKSAIESTPLILDGTCYTGTLDGRLYALDAATGVKKWEFEAGGKITGGANWARDPKGDANWVLVGSHDFMLYAVDAKTGKEAWRVETENYVYSTPSVTKGGLALFGSCDAQVHVVSLSERKTVRKLDGEGFVGGGAAVDGATAFFGSDGKKVFAFNVETGAQSWAYRDRNFGYQSSPALSVEVVLIGGQDKRLHCLDRKTGEAKWTFATKADVDGSPVLCSDGGILFGGMDGRFYCVELADGKKRWEYEIGQDIFASPAVAAGAVVIGAADGVVYCFGK